MASARYSLLKVTILLAFFIIASDLCMMKSEARGPIYRLPCDNDKECQVGCRNPNCGCGSRCIDNVCQCPHEASMDAKIITPPPISPPQPSHLPPPPPPHSPPQPSHLQPPPHSPPQPSHLQPPPPPHSPPSN